MKEDVMKNELREYRDKRIIKKHEEVERVTHMTGDTRVR